MKILNSLNSTANVRYIRSAANKLKELNVLQDISAFYHSLSPQWFAEYMGLKKLIEKDYSTDEDEITGVLPSL